MSEATGGGAAVQGGADRGAAEAARRNLRMVLRAARRFGPMPHTQVRGSGGTSTPAIGGAARVSAALQVGGRSGPAEPGDIAPVGRAERTMFFRPAATPGEGRVPGGRAHRREGTADTQHGKLPARGAAAVAGTALRGGAAESAAGRRVGSAGIRSLEAPKPAAAGQKRHFLLRRPVAMGAPAPAVGRTELTTLVAAEGARGDAFLAVNSKAGAVAVAPDGNGGDAQIAGRVAKLRWPSGTMKAGLGGHGAAVRSPPLAYAGQKAASVSRAVTAGAGAMPNAPKRAVGHAETAGGTAADGGVADQAGRERMTEKSADMGAQDSGPRTIAGDVYLDGQLVGRWMEKHLARQAGRPPTGSPAFDPTRSPYPLGRMIGT